MKVLEKSLRAKLENTTTQAREKAEAAALHSLRHLGIGEPDAPTYLNEEQRLLRRRLRAHGRGLGDSRNVKGIQELEHLVSEVAYEHWHRMLFARFLAENQLLVHPEFGVAVSLEECKELAKDAAQGRSMWDVAAGFAGRMLPQIFRQDSPCFAVGFPPEEREALERLLSSLAEQVFTADDSLGWVYQFWQSKKKDEVNASEVKIGADELPAVTQLFTEPYMVSFLLDNSLGAWWAGKKLTKKHLAEAPDEVSLRALASLPGLPLEYLRFIRSDGGPWRPAAGTFSGWPESLMDFWKWQGDFPPLRKVVFPSARKPEFPTPRKTEFPTFFGALCGPLDW